MTRIYHAGRDRAHRERDAALAALGVSVQLVVPSSWPGPDDPHDERFEVVELAVRRPGDVNRWTFRDDTELTAAVARFQPDLIDAHLEPVSLAGRQALRVAGGLPTVMYTAQNLDKRWPPPFGSIERSALKQVRGIYPCSRQAASVIRGKGYAGVLRVLPLGIDASVHQPGQQELSLGDELVLGFVGRLVPEKGLLDAIRVLAGLLPARLIVVGEGPELAPAQALAAQLGVTDSVTWVPWVDASALAELYRSMHVVLIPSRTSPTWVEQFGRVITEGQANGAVPVGYSSGSIPEVIADTGIVVGEGHLEQLVAGISALRSSPRQWQGLRDAGIRRAEAWSWAAVARGQLELYELAVRAAPLEKLRADREAAVAEFGLPARGALSTRPWALPVLRTSRAAHRIADRWAAR